MNRVWLLTPMDVPDDTDPARVVEEVNDALHDDDGNAWQRFGSWSPGDAVLAEPPDCHVRVYAWPSGSEPGSIVRHAHGPDEPCSADCDYSGMGGGR